jgi:hypothetical protein
VGWLLISTPPIYAQESAKFEKIPDISLDKKFGVRISCVRKPKERFEEENCFEEIGRSLLTQFIFRSGAD